MAIRTDVAVNWELSPRLIEIENPSTEFSAQDSGDTLRSLEHLPNAGYDTFSHDYIIDLSGKEDLGGGTSVGITLVYRDAQVAFGRTASRSSGTVTTGSSTQLIDSLADFVTDLVQRGDWVINFTDQSVTEVLEVVDLNTLNVRTLSDGTDNDFDIGDVYKVWEVAECSLAGGNHTAQDDAETTINPLFTTFGRFASIAASSSATLQSAEQLEAASFAGKEGLGCHIAPTSGSDTGVLPGRREEPVKTETKLDEVLSDRGFRNVYVIESLTITAVHTSEHVWFGDNPQTTIITLDNSCDVTNHKFQDCFIQGKLDSGNIIWECIVGSITNANGFIYQSTLIGPIVVSDNLSIERCWVAPTATNQEVTIDFTSLANVVLISSWNGGRVLVKNMTTGSILHMQGTGGKITLDSTNTGGTARIYGAIELVDNSTIDVLDDDTTQSLTNTFNMTEDYPVDGQSSATPAQMLYSINQMLSEFARTGVLVSVKKRDGTQAFELTLDSATAPTSSTQTA